MLVRRPLSGTSSSTHLPYPTASGSLITLGERLRAHCFETLVGLVVLCLPTPPCNPLSLPLTQPTQLPNHQLTFTTTTATTTQPTPNRDVSEKRKQRKGDSGLTGVVCYVISVCCVCFGAGECQGVQPVCWCCVGVESVERDRCHHAHVLGRKSGMRRLPLQVVKSVRAIIEGLN